MKLNLRPENFKPKCVHVMHIDNWYPELTYYTLPLIKAWADRIGADFKLITERKFAGFPVNYERLQIYERGKEYFWNINVDADYMIHPEMEDPTEGADPYVVMTEGRMETSSYFKPNIYFFRDQRGQSVGDSFVVSSMFTHDVWEPLDCTYEEAKQECINLADERQVSEFALSLNVARYGLKYDGAISDKSKIHHVGATTGTAKDGSYDPVKVAKEFVEKWGVQNIIEEFHKAK